MFANLAQISQPTRLEECPDLEGIETGNSSKEQPLVFRVWSSAPT